MTWLLDTNALIKSYLLSKKIFKRNITITTIFSILEYPIVLNNKELTVIYPNDQIFERSVDIVAKLRKKGTLIPIVDLLNGVTAMDENAILVSNDSHFKFFKAVEPSLELISIEDFLKAIQKKEKK